MQLLIIGQGAREHTLAWKLAQDNRVTKIWVAPGNAGTELEDKVTNIDIASTDIISLVEFAKINDIAYTIVGPEAPLVAGIADKFTANNLAIFAPSQQASQLEGSKSFAKDFLQRYQIPTADYASFTNIKPALEYLDQMVGPWVIKADGLAAGKGVIISQDKQEAIDVVIAMLANNKLGSASKKIVIEKFLQGQEASFIAMVDSKQNILPLATSQDHKARDNGDTGPNTGGMGAYSPAPIINQALSERIIEEIMQPTILNLQQEGINYSGFLYVGLMIDEQGNPNVLEFNCRLGDPEAEAVLMRLDSSLLDLIIQAISGELNQAKIAWKNQATVSIVMAAKGYPETYNKGSVIQGIDKITNAKVFHAGTKIKNNNVITAGGRVLCVTALGDNIKQAQQLAYANVAKIKWDNLYYRTDIANKALV